MQQWLVDHKIPLGVWIKQGVDALKQAQWIFDGISAVLEFFINGLTSLLLWPPAPLIVLVLCLFAWWLHRSVWLVVFIVAAMALIVNLGFWKPTMQTLTLVSWSTFICMALGVPFGIAAAHRPWLFNAVRPVLDLMQTLPTFVYLIPTLILFGLGVVPGLISTVIFALPAPIRLTQLGISTVPKSLLEAGESFGATRRQLLWKVELPYALPSIMAGVTQCIMLSLSMVVIAALVAADGLGVPVVRALNSVNIGMGFEAGLCIVLLAIVLDRVFKQASGAAGKR